MNYLCNNYCSFCKIAPNSNAIGWLYSVSMKLYTMRKCTVFLRLHLLCSLIDWSKTAFYIKSMRNQFWHIIYYNVAVASCKYNKQMILYAVKTMMSVSTYSIWIDVGTVFSSIITVPKITISFLYCLTVLFNYIKVGAKYLNYIHQGSLWLG